MTITKGINNPYIGNGFRVCEKYMHIDSAAHQYTIAITDEQREAEGISKENLAKIFKIVTDLNQRIDNDFNAGKIVTMYLTTKEKFISYTIDPLHQLHDINFKDVRTKQLIYSYKSWEMAIFRVLL